MDSDQGFRAARQAGERGPGRLVFPLVLIAFLALLGFVAQPFPFADDGGSGTSPVFLGVLGLLAAIALFVLVRDVRRRVRRNNAWGRAAKGAAALTLSGAVVAKQRTVAGRPMRTVVVQHGGGQRYVHLLFATGAPAGALRQGPVTVEFFAGNDVEGPARILLPDGRVAWAFASRLGGPAPVGNRRSGSRGMTGSARGASAGAVIPAASIAAPAVGDDADRSREDDGSGLGESVWSGDDGWTGGSSWGGDPTWTGADGGSGGGSAWSGGDFGAGWSGGDFGGGGGDSGGGGGS